ncbi:MAG: secretin N-terminal domain-containing protein, partial [Candidatus Sedimenticola sp. 6PFRAG5]
DSSPGRRLFVYRLKHGKAENIATVLQEIYGQSTAGDSNSNPAGRPPEARANVRPPVVSAITTPQNEASGQAAAQAAAVVAAAQAPVSDAGSDILSANQGQVTIIADQDNNSILVLASARDYRSVEATLRRLDIAPKQVLIEATVAEVKLTD